MHTGENNVDECEDDSNGWVCVCNLVMYLMCSIGGYNGLQ